MSALLYGAPPSPRRPAVRPTKPFDVKKIVEAAERHRDVIEDPTAQDLTRDAISRLTTLRLSTMVNEAGRAELDAVIGMLYVAASMETT